MRSRQAGGFWIQVEQVENTNQENQVVEVEQVEVEHFKSNTEGNADEELYVVVQEDAWQEEWSRIFQIMEVLAEMISVRNG